MFKTLVVSLVLLAAHAPAKGINSFTLTMGQSLGSVPEAFEYLSSDSLTLTNDLDLLNIGLGYALPAAEIQFEQEPSAEALFQEQTFSFTPEVSASLAQPMVLSLGALMGFGTYQLLQYSFEPDSPAAPGGNMVAAAIFPESSDGRVYFAISGVLLFASRRWKQSLS